ncbi:MAG TPA: hypothetical protein VL856_14095 [Acidimicrobiia bacterium]|jgi:hypothetical protein|nr:hypothetical protein [Acidimicrobiia bacterium]
MAGRTLDTPSTAAARSRDEEAIEILGRLEALLATRNAATQAGQTTLVAPAARPTGAHDDHLPRFGHRPHWQDVLRAVLPFWLSIAAAAVTLIAFELVARSAAFVAAIVALAILAIVHRRSDDANRSLALGALCGVALGFGVALIS